MVDDMLAAPKGDANDVMYQWAAAADYNPAPGLSRIQAPLLVINSADDERNPPETKAMQTSLHQLQRARLLLIPASAETRGHATLVNATFYAEQLGAFMQATARH
jgi:homoserine O-acetyltransferase